MPGEALETSEAVERAVLWVDGLGARKLSRFEGNLIHGGRTEPVLACVSAVIGSHRFPPSSTGIRSGLRMPMELDRYAIGMARLANAMIAFGDARERPSVRTRRNQTSSKSNGSRVWKTNFAGMTHTCCMHASN